MASVQTLSRSAGLFLFISLGFGSQAFPLIFFPTEGYGFSVHEKVEKRETSAGFRGREDLGPHENNTDLLYTRETLFKGTGSPSVLGGFVTSLL